MVLGKSATALGRRRMEGFVNGEESARERKHDYRSHYDLADYGLGEGEIHERFAAYMDRFGITKGA
ncbi:MAG: hypothetical protein M0R03_03325 [Novosphingobium sp.]|nr:hypothetical protein [Novosphingobium sp.]